MYKVVFFGSPPFAAQVLEALIEKKVNIVGVVTQPDRILGKRVQKSAVKKIVEQKYPHISLMQPIKASSNESIEEIKKLLPDIFIIVAYGQILKQPLLDVPTMESLNVHGSLLPKYRGAAPVQRAVMEGEKETGITIMKVVLELDAGDILKERKIPIQSDMTAGDVFNIMAKWAPDMLIEVMQDIERGTAHYIKQDPTQATYAKKIQKKECHIHWDRSAEEIHNLVRGLSPVPGAYAEIMVGEEKKRLKILLSKITPFSLPVKECQIIKNSIAIGTKTNAVELISVQLEGKKKMSIAEFLQGIREKITVL